jgi:hypothetical protein
MSREHLRIDECLYFAFVLTVSLPLALKADESLLPSVPASVATSASNRRFQGRGGQNACAPAIPELAKQHTRNWSSIWVVPINKDYEGLHFGEVVSINGRPGYNASPSFSPTGGGYFSWRPDHSQAVGLAAVQFAHAAGMKVFGTAGSEEGSSEKVSVDWKSVSPMRFLEAKRRQTSIRRK